MEIYSINHDLGGTLWCGPAALSAITGQPTSNLVSPDGQYHPLAMENILKRFGIQFRYDTLRGKLEDVSTLCLNIVDDAPVHYVVTKDGMLVDSGNGTPTKIENTRFRNVEVKHRWAIRRSPVTMVGVVYNDKPDLLEQVCKAMEYTRGVMEGKLDLHPRLFSFLRPPATYCGDWVQIPPMDRAGFQIFYMKTLPHLIKTDWLMHVGADGFILNPESWDDRFFNYDFIGAPWESLSVGNDGFSLQSKRFFERCTTLPHMDGTQNGDWFALVNNQEAFRDLSIAPVEMAAKFSIEVPTQHHEEKPFGFHGSHSRDEAWRRLNDWFQNRI